MDDLEQRKLFSAVCHGSIFLSSTIIAIGCPIVILAISPDAIVQANAKEAINFHINLYLYGILFVLLIPVLVGIPLLLLLGLVSFIMPIIAIVQTVTTVDRSYRYPFIFRLVS